VRDPRARGILCGKKGCVQHLFDFVDHGLKCEVTKGGRTIRHSSKTARPLYYYLSTTRAFVPAPKHEPLCREVLVPKPGWSRQRWNIWWILQLRVSPLESIAVLSRERINWRE
jgi:hypothetical protein